MGITWEWGVVHQACAFVRFGLKIFKKTIGKEYIESCFGGCGSAGNEKGNHGGKQPV